MNAPHLIARLSKKHLDHHNALADAGNAFSEGAAMFSGARFVNNDGHELLGEPNKTGKLAFTEAVYDEGGYLTLPGTDITIPAAGKYRASAQVQAYLASGEFLTLIVTNDSQGYNDGFGRATQPRDTTGSPTYTNVSTTFLCSAGDRIQVFVATDCPDPVFVLGGVSIERID
jgi:hypothetical protein